MSSALRELFVQQGYVGPFRAISEDEAKTLTDVLLPALQADSYSPAARRNRHFDMAAVHRVAISPIIADLLAEIYSPELCLWRSHVFTGRKGHGLGWHSDYFRKLLADPLDHLTLHFAVTEAPADNCLMVIPGSHRWTAKEREEAGFELIGKTLDTGYGTPYYVRNGKRVEIRPITLQPGEFFVFNPGLLHASIDRVGDTSLSNPLLSAVKKLAKRVLGSLGRYGAAPPPSRLAIGFRYCDPRNAISPTAFRESESKAHGPAYIAGKELPDGPTPFADWRGEVEAMREDLSAKT